MKAEQQKISLKRIKLQAASWLLKRGYFGLGQRMGRLLSFFLLFVVGGLGIFQWGSHLILSQIKEVQVAQQITTETNQVLLQLYQAQGHQQAFSLQPTEAEAELFITAVTKAQAETSKLAHQASDPRFKEQVAELADLVKSYQENFEQIRSFRESMGFTPALGFRGRFAHSAEQMQQALIDLRRTDLRLSLQEIRLAERDFFLGQLSAGRVVKEKMTQLRKTLSTLKQAEPLTKPAGLIDGYLSNFDRIKFYTYKIKDLTDSFNEHFEGIPVTLKRLDLLALERQTDVGQKTKEAMISLGNEFLVLGLFTFVFISIFGWLLTRSILRPVKAVVTLTEQLSRGDLTRKLESKSLDEIGQMSRSLNRFTSSLKRTMGGIHSNSDTLNITSLNLAASTRQIEATTDRANQSVERSNHRLRAVSTTLKGLADDNAQITSEVRLLVAASSRTAQAAHDGNQNICQVQDSMDQIDQSSTAMFQVLRSMQKIRDRVEMLSFNATIEAVRAGPEGKGFFVVASEIKRLSEHTKEELGKITQMVEAGRSHALAGRETVAQAKEQFQSVVSQVETINQGLCQVTDSIYAQDEKTKQLSLDTEDLSHLSSQNSSTLFELAATIKQVDQTTAELSLMAAELRTQVLVFKVS